MNQDLVDWLKTRPKIIQDMVTKYPPGSIINDRYIISYCENGSLGVSKIDPTKDYEAAINAREYICTSCVSRVRKPT